MENKTKGKHQSTLEQYVDFLLKVQNCNYPFMDNIRDVDKRDEQKVIKVKDKLIDVWPKYICTKDKIENGVTNLVHDEPGDISNKTYEKLTSDIIKSWFKDTGEKEPKADIKWSLVAPNSTYPNITEDPTAECVYDKHKYKGNTIGYEALEDYGRITKGTKSFLKRTTDDAYLFKVKGGGYSPIGHGLLWKTRFKKITKFGEDLTPVVDANKTRVKPLDTNLPLVGPIKNLETAVNTLLQEEVNLEAAFKPKKVITGNTYNVVTVFKFEKDFELNSKTKEHVPKGSETYKRSNTNMYTVYSNLDVAHDFTDKVIDHLLESKCLSSEDKIRPVDRYGLIK